MPKVKRSEYIEFLLVKLKNNVELLKKIVPDFNMTEEQMREYINNKLEAHLIAKSVPPYAQTQPANTEKANSYFPSENTPGYMARSLFDVVRNVNTDEAEAYNKIVFSGITRDDEYGKKKEINYIVNCLNAPYRLDRDVLKKDVFSPEFAKYAVRYANEGNIALTYKSIIDNSPVKMKSDTKYNVVKGFAEEVGNIMTQYSAVIGSEFGVSLPLDMLTDAQYSKVLDYATLHAGDAFKTSADMNMKEILNFAVEKQGFYPAIKTLNEKMSAFEAQYAENGFTENDIEYRDPENAKTMGGYTNRVNNAIAMKEQIDALDVDVPNLAALKTGYAELCTLLGGYNSTPDDGELQKIQSAVGNVRKVMFGCRKTLSAKAERNEKENEAISVLTEVLNDLTPFRDMEQLSALVKYQREQDNGTLEENAPDIEEINRAREAADASAPVTDYDAIARAEEIEIPETEVYVTGDNRIITSPDFKLTVNKPEEKKGFVNVTEADAVLNNGEKGRVEHGRYFFSDRFTAAFANLNALTGSDSSEMKSVKDAFKDVKKLDEKGGSPEEIKAAIEKLSQAAKSYKENPHKRHNNRWETVSEVLAAANGELDTLKDVRSANEVNRGVDQILLSLNMTFSMAERMSKGAVNRYDCVMIGGKTLRGLITEEIASKYNGSAWGWSSEDKKAVENPDPIHAAKLIYAALAENKKVEMFKVDPKTYSIPVKGSTGKPELEFSKPTVIRNVSKETLAQVKNELYKDVKIDFSKKENALIVKDREDCCCKAVILNNWQKRANQLLPDDKKFNMMIQSWQEAHKNEPDYNPNGWRKTAAKFGIETFTLDRGAIPAIMNAYLMVENGMKIEEILDPNFKPELKAAAAVKVIDLMTSDKENNAPEKLADIGVKATLKLLDHVDSVMKEIDYNDDRSLYSEKTVYFNAISQIIQNLSQELQKDKGAERNVEWRAAMARHFKTENDPDKAEKINSYIDNRIRGVVSIKYLFDNNRDEVARIGTGCAIKNSNSMVQIMQGEYIRQLLCRKPKDDTSIVDLMRGSEYTTNSAFFGDDIVSPIDMQMKDSEIRKDFTKLIGDGSLDSRGKFAQELINGRIRSDYYMGVNGMSAYFVKKDRLKSLNRADKTIVETCERAKDGNQPKPEVKEQVL